MENIKFSVVIPLYNKEYSIKGTLETVLNQTYKNFEIIIVDDGSTDNSLILIKNGYVEEIESKQVILHSSSNQGVSAARNKGVSLTTSDYVCFLDADDEWKPDFLENLRKLVLRFPYAGLYCLQHQTVYNNEIVKKNKVLYPECYFGIVDNFFKRSLHGSLANSSKVCVKKEALKYVSGFPIGQKSGEDLFVWMEIALYHPVAFYNKISTVINMVSDGSRVGRNLSVPYPFIYYSDEKNKTKLNVWSKIYLYKIYLSHVYESFRARNYVGYCSRVDSGRKIYPLSAFLFGFLKLPMKALRKDV